MTYAYSKSLLGKMADVNSRVYFSWLLFISSFSPFGLQGPGLLKFKMLLLHTTITLPTFLAVGFHILPL